MSEQVTKLELGFDEAAIGILNEMVAAAHADSKERVIKDAIRLYDWYLKTINDGGELVLKYGQKYNRVKFEF